MDRPKAYSRMLEPQTGILKQREKGVPPHLGVSPFVARTGWKRRGLAAGATIPFGSAAKGLLSPGPSMELLGGSMLLFCPYRLINLCASWFDCTQQGLTVTWHGEVHGFLTSEYVWAPKISEDPHCEYEGFVEELQIEDD